MKKQLLIIIPIVTLIILAILALGYLLFSGLVFDSGRAVVSDTGACFITYDNGMFYVMNDSTKAGSLFDDLETGDKILILRKNYVAESYPEQCYVKLCIRLGRGTADNVDLSVLNELVSLGYLAQDEKLPATDREISAIINANSNFVFNLLQEMTEEDLKENYAEKGFGCYTVKLGTAVNITYEDKCISEEYECEYFITHYPDESDEGWFVTGFTTNNPYERVCGVMASSGIEKIREAFESKGFLVTVEEQKVTAVGGGITVSFVIRGEKDVNVSVNADVTNKNGIIY